MINDALNNALDRLERSIRNYHDSGCFIYLPSGACDCGMSVDQDALAALATVRDGINDAKLLLQEVLDEHIHIGLEYNWCNFCGLNEGHEHYCVVPRIETYLKEG